MTEKQFHISQLVATCIKKGYNPTKIGFSDFVYRLCATYFGYEKRTTKNYIDVLIQSFRFDKWKSLVASNGFLSEDEKQQWMKAYS